MSDKELGRFTYKFGGSLFITTVLYHNGEQDGIYLNQDFILSDGAGNDARFSLCSDILTPGKLREFANELDKAINVAKVETRVK